MAQSNNSKSPPYNFLDTPGNMAKLIREYDWENTVLGSPSNWSSSLKNTISMLLHSRFPIILLWGDDYIQFFNDAYHEVLGNSTKHPKSIGQKGADCWKTAWPKVKAQIDEIIFTGVANWNEDEIVLIDKGGKTIETYWTNSYSKVPDLDGNMAGVLVICNETTAKVASDKQMKKAYIHLAESEARLRFMLEGAPVAIAVLSGEDLIIETANEQMLQIWGKDKILIGKKIEEGLPELIDQGFIDILKNVFLTSVPFYGNEIKAFFEQNNKKEELYSNFVFQPIKGQNGLTTHIMVVANIVTEQVLARQKVEDAEEMLRLSVEAANVGTWSLNLESGALVVSERMVELFYFNLSDNISFDMLMTRIPQKFAEKVIERINLAINQSVDYVLEHPIVIEGADNQERWVRALGKIQLDEQDNSRIFSGLMIDITEQKLDGQRKNDFIGMVSHELKTPITSLSAYLQLLHIKSIKSRDLSTTEILDKVNNQVRKMTQLINGFLDVSRLEAGKIILDKHQFNLIDLVRQIREDTLITSSSTTINLIADKPIFIQADYDKIGSVITNLLSNAVKYSASGSEIIIEVKRNDTEAIVSVADKGLGIKNGDLKKLFDRFYRSESNITKHISGFGIGLYLSAEIVIEHGGKIWVESEEGIGSTFFFSLPLNQI